MLLYSNDEFISSLLENQTTFQIHEKNTNSFFYVLTTSDKTYPCVRMKLNHLCEIGQPSNHKSFLKINTIQDILFIFLNEHTMNDYIKYCEHDVNSQQCIFKI
jgi:hypothetical protein